MRGNSYFSVVCGALMLVIFGLTSLLAYGGTCDRMQVTFKEGQLGIQSNGCSLQQVLEAVKDKTGIELETPASAAAIPVTINLEPGEPKAVLGLLLHDTDFNYILIAGDGNTLSRIILTERSAAVVPAVSALTPPPASDAALKAEKAASAVSAAAKEPATKDPKKKKEEKKVEDEVAAVEDDGDDALKKPELDDATLKKLPQLPPGIDPGMWRLYPSIVQNGGVVPDGPPTFPGGGSLVQPTSGQAGMSAQSGSFEDPLPGPKGVIGLPTLPPEIDPNMGKLYPWNLMQLIQGPIIYPNVTLPPPAKPVPWLGH
jgi:hypothetical protein